MPSRMLALLIWCVCTVPLVFPGIAQAIAIAFAHEALGGQHYRTTYTVTNDGSLGAGVPVTLFDIAFDPALYAETSLQIVTPDPPASGWSELLLASAPGVPAEYDALALAGGIPVGASVAGFAVEFVWHGGPGGPGAQPFTVSNPQSFVVLEGGTTTPLQTTPVSEPGTFVLLSLGVLRLAWWRMTRWLTDL